MYGIFPGEMAVELSQGGGHPIDIGAFAAQNRDLCPTRCFSAGATLLIFRCYPLAYREDMPRNTPIRIFPK